MMHHADVAILWHPLQQHSLLHAAAGVSFLWCIILSVMQGKYDAEGSDPTNKKLEEESSSAAALA